MLLRLFFVISVLLTTVLTVFLPALFPWCFLLVLGIWSGITVGAIVFLFVISLFLIGKEPSEEEHPFLRSLAWHTMDCILAFFRFRIDGDGLERIPEEPCVVVCNHLSRFDPMVTAVLMKNRKIVFVSKKENMKIPIAGPILNQIGYVALDRENPLRAMRAIHRAANLVMKKSYTVGIYPEGTRSKSGELLEFKTGAFVLAKRAACPIVVSSVVGTNSYRGRFPFRSTKARFRVLDVIPSEAVKRSKPEELSVICRSLIEQSIR